MTSSQSSSSAAIRGYLIVTLSYWAFTVTDGALRMLVVLYFHGLGYSPLAVAMLFLFYEAFGIVTNLVGGWLGARIGLNRTLHIGMGLQIVALGLLSVPASWLSIPLVMGAQALSGIAKDLNKMSAKGSVRLLVSDGEVAGRSRLLTFTAALTGSKNALKGAGFFVGALLLEQVGFQGAMGVLAGFLALVFVIVLVVLSTELGRQANKPKFSEMLSRSPAINRLAAARLFLFGARDTWFVVGLPVFLHAELGWDVPEVGAYLALWIIGYGVVQGFAPLVLQRRGAAQSPGGGAARRWGMILLGVMVALAWSLSGASGVPGSSVLDPRWTVVAGLLVFGVVFAINSALHSYLVLAYAQADQVSMNVGFYYMANAGGRLLGTLLSGLVYQSAGLSGCLWAASVMIALAWVASLRLPEVDSHLDMASIETSD